MLKKTCLTLKTRKGFSNPLCSFSFDFLFHENKHILQQKLINSKLFLILDFKLKKNLNY